MTDSDPPRANHFMSTREAELRDALRRSIVREPAETPAAESPPYRAEEAVLTEVAPDEPAAPRHRLEAPVIAHAADDHSDDDVDVDDDDVGSDQKGRSDRLRSAVEWVAVVVGALVVALVVKTFLFQAFYIPSASMEPTLDKGDRVLVNKVSYDLHDVHRGDVVVFELAPEDVGQDGIKDLIKRVIGLPGDEIETRDGAVYVNDRALDEPYLADGTRTGDTVDAQNPPIALQTVPEGHVYVLGDNRSNSADSRYRGPIPIDSIIGRAFILVWPPGDIGGL